MQGTKSTKKASKSAGKSRKSSSVPVLLHSNYDWASFILSVHHNWRELQSAETDLRKMCDKLQLLEGLFQDMTIVKV